MVERNIPQDVGGTAHGPVGTASARGVRGKMVGK